MVDTHIRCVESDSDIRLDVRALDMEIWPKTCPISRFLNIHPQTPLSTVRTSLKHVDGPIWCGESDDVVRLDVRACPAEIWPKTCSIPRFLNIHPQSASSTVRTPLERVDTRIRCAESDGNIRLDVHALDMEIWPKTCPISRFLDIHPQTPWSTVRTPLGRVDGPIWCAESDGVVRLAIRVVCEEIWLKTCPISRFLNIHPRTP